MFIKDQDETNETLLLHEIARQLCTSFDRRAQHLNLTRTQWRALSILRRHPGIRQNHMAEMLEVEPITLVRLLDRMEKAGWIERRPDPKDRRANQIYLTEKVEDIVKDMRAIALNVRRNALEGFTQEEHSILISYLKRIKTNASYMISESEKTHEATPKS